MAIFPFLITLFIMFSLFLFTADFGLDSSSKTNITVQSEKTEIIDGIPHTTTERYQGNSIMDFLMSNSITSGVLEFIVYTLGSIATVILSVFIAITVIGFFTPVILEKIRQKHYPDLEKNSHGNLFTSVWVLTKSLAVMVLLFFVLIPLYFVPVLNIVAFNLPFYYFFHKMINYDVSSSILNKEEYKKIKYYDKERIRLRTLLLYLFSLIPLTGLIFPIFYVIYIGHGYMSRLIKEGF